MPGSHILHHLGMILIANAAVTTGRQFSVNYYNDKVHALTKFLILIVEPIPLLLPLPLGQLSNPLIAVCGLLSEGSGFVD